MLMGGGILQAYGQAAKTEDIAYGDMNKWLVRVVEESFVIGGQTKLLYEVAEGDTLKNNTPYVNQGSPWATSSVMAKVSGVVKSSTTVFPEERGDGFCARLETRMETVKVLGLVNITVLAAGTVFLGGVVEPVRDTKNPLSKLMMGVPFDKKPAALSFDYKVKQGNGGKRIRATGFSKVADIPGTNAAEVCLLLQHRWEDADGNIFAKRVGTAWEQYEKDVPNWENDHRVQIQYGDITKTPGFEPFMGLLEEDPQYCRNSKGEVVPIQEVGWAGPDEKVTHLVLRFSSSHGGAYVGSPGSIFWIDNVKFIYD